MMLMKGCPRCSGDLVVARDPSEDEPILSCLQCGYQGYRHVAMPEPEPMSIGANEEAA